MNAIARAMRARSPDLRGRRPVGDGADGSLEMQGGRVERPMRAAGSGIKRSRRRSGPSKWEPAAVRSFPSPRATGRGLRRSLKN